MFAGLMGDLVQTSRRTDISAVDADCIKSTIQDLVEISQELSSYEYLITIEKDLTDFGENSPMRDVVKFALDKSTNVLAGERKKLAQPSDQCARSPLGSAKAQQALQVVDTTAGILRLDPRAVLSSAARRMKRDIPRKPASMSAPRCEPLRFFPGGSTTRFAWQAACERCPR